jgi:hypothetical protein
MKPCVCNGSNDNCRYCSGSGYVPDDKPLPKGVTKNPYIGMEPPTPPRLDPGIEEVFWLGKQKERNRLEARRAQKRKNILVFAALLLLTLLLYLFFRWCDAHMVRLYPLRDMIGQNPAPVLAAGRRS